MHTQAICHAALLVTEQNTSLLIDPWIQGTVFMGGWRLQPEPLEEVLSSLPQVDYIYLTHEHSDHTHIPSLKYLFEGPAKNATLLIPKFMTKRFYTWLHKSFPNVPIIEMDHGKAFQFGPMTAWSYQYRNDDSTIVLRAPDGYTILNTNDTFVKGIPLRELLRKYPNPDVLISQYSVSNAYPYAYADYLSDPKSFPWDREDLKSYCVDLIKLVKPRMWIPYQSFVRFCRPENNFLNEFRITIDEIEGHVAPHIKEDTRIVKLYPGDTLKVDQYIAHPKGKEHFYSTPLPTAEPDTPQPNRDELLKYAHAFEASFKDSVAWVFRRQLRPCGFISEEDGTHFIFDPHKCRFTIGDAQLKKDHPEFSWTSTTQRILTESFKLPWGMASLLISGSMKTEVPASFRGGDFLFWAIGLIRHTGYFNLKSLWFLKPRALFTMFRRRYEAYDILIKSIRAGGLTKGNILPRRNTVS